MYWCNVLINALGLTMEYGFSGDEGGPSVLRQPRKEFGKKGCISWERNGGARLRACLQLLHVRTDWTSIGVVCKRVGTLAARCRGMQRKFVRMRESYGSMLMEGDKQASTVSLPIMFRSNSEDNN